MKPSGKKSQAFPKTYVLLDSQDSGNLFQLSKWTDHLWYHLRIYTAKKLTLESNTWTLVPTTVVSLCPFCTAPRQKPHQEQFVFSCLMQISLCRWSVSFSFPVRICQPLPRLESLHCGTERKFTSWLHVLQEKEDRMRNSLATNWKEFITFLEC